MTSTDSKKEDMDNEENNIEEEDKINDEEFEKFQNVLSKELVLELYSIFKLFEKKGLINYKIYIEAMTEIFKKYNKDKDKNKNFKDIFDLIFNRFQKIKCIMKNDKKVFYLTNMLPQNLIETYIIVCFLTIFIKCRIIDKIKLLFELTDIDDDGFLNKTEIKLMISKINFMFSEEYYLINTNSSILAQSLMNIKVKEKINKIMYDPGNLNVYLEKEKYISFDVFYNSLIKINNYKYEIIPCFINMKQCLYNKRSEKILEVKNKYKKEFVRASSALSSNKPGNPFKRYKRNFSANNLGRIIKNVKINKDNNLKENKKKHLLLGIKEKNKSFKELLKESTIFSDEEYKNDETDNNKQNSFEEYGISTASKRISFHNTTKSKDKPFYIFEADFDKIKKIEVEPALLRFSNKNYEKINFNNDNNKNNSINNIINNNIEKKKKILSRYNSTLSNKSKDLKLHRNTFHYKQNHLSTKDLTKNKFFGNKNEMSFNKRGSIVPMQIRSNLFNNFNFHGEQNVNLYNQIFNSNDNSRVAGHNSDKLDFNINYITLSKNLKDAKPDFKNGKRPSSFNNNINIFKKRIITKLENEKINKDKKQNDINENKIVKKNNIAQNVNRYRFKRKNFNRTFNKFKYKKKVDNKRINKYLSANDIFKDVDKNEEKLRHERTEYFGKELIALYKKMLKEKKEIRAIVGKYDKYDISLNFFDFKKKAFPKDYGKSIFSSNKYY